MTMQTLTLDGRDYVIIAKTDWDRLAARSGIGDELALPSLPRPDADGNVDAIAYARASIARDVIKERRAVGLSQLELARLAGVRQETISRIETGKQTVTRRTIGKIDKALLKATRRRVA
jgi:DNA-binding XRE family transcriptional regulator